MKLYLTLPTFEENELFDVPQLNDAAKLKLDLRILKLKNVIYLYRLARKHIERMDHIKIDEISENIDVVIEFVQQFEDNLKFIAKQTHP